MGLFGKSYDYKFNKEAAHQEKMLEKEQAFTQNMWNQTNEWNLAQWNRENEYNSPVSQMQRFALAGINPNNAAAAIAGNDSSAGSAMASSPSSPSAPGSPSPVGTDLSQQILGVGGTALDAITTGINAYKTINAEVPNINADTGNKQADTNLKNEQTLTTQQQRENLVEELRGMKFENVHIKPATLDAINSNNALTVEKANEVKQNIKNLQGEYELNQKAIQEKEEAIKIAKEQVSYWKEQTKLAVSEQDKAAAATQLDKANAALASATTALTNEQKRGDRIVNDYKQELSDLGIDPNGTGNVTAEGAKTAAVNAKRAAKNGNSSKGKNNNKTYRKYNPNPFSHGRASSNNHRNMDKWTNLKNNSEYGSLE